MDLVNDVTTYEYGSARFYLRDEQSAYPVINFMELDDNDLTKFIT